MSETAAPSRLVRIIFIVATAAVAVGRRGSGTGDWTERGVKLGMSEAEIVRSFAGGAAGDGTRVGGCRGVALEWTRRTAGVPTRWARFELHEGALVAMRARRHVAATGTPSALRPPLA